MTARIIGLYTAVVTFLGLKSHKRESCDVDRLIVDSFNKSHREWAAKGWIKEERQVSQKV